MQLTDHLGRTQYIEARFDYTTKWARCSRKRWERHFSTMHLEGPAGRWRDELPTAIGVWTGRLTMNNYETDQFHVIIYESDREEFFINPKTLGTAFTKMGRRLCALQSKVPKLKPLSYPPYCNIPNFGTEDQKEDIRSLDYVTKMKECGHNCSSAEILDWLKTALAVGAYYHMTEKDYIDLLILRSDGKLHTDIVSMDLDHFSLEEIVIEIETIWGKLPSPALALDELERLTQPEPNFTETAAKVEKLAGLAARNKPNASTKQERKEQLCREHFCRLLPPDYLQEIKDHARTYGFSATFVEMTRMVAQRERRMQNKAEAEQEREELQLETAVKRLVK